MFVTWLGARGFNRPLAFFVLLVSLTTGSVLFAQDRPQIEIDKEFNFGKIPQGKPVSHRFFLRNKGRIPVIIKAVNTTCGCTATSFSKAPVLHNKKGYIEATFNAATTGPFHKEITALTSIGEIKMVLTGEVFK